MIDIKKATILVDLLKSGRTLIMDHLAYGKYSFKMNQQQNVIYCNPIDSVAKNHELECKIVTDSGTVHVSSISICENPEKYLLNCYGTWYIEVTPATTRTIVEEIPGVYEDIFNVT